MTSLSPNPAAAPERLQAHSSEIGAGFTVRRALPNRARRMVGAWCFLDHAGPVVHGPGQGSVGPHPHIGLQTFTWMLEGEILHRDSLGYVQPIRPGQVNLMTSGNGIVHAEEAQQRAGEATHLVQLWIALPEAERRRAPAFQHYPDLPRVALEGFEVTVLAGRALGQQSPVQVYSPLLGLDLRAEQAAQATLELDPAFEHAVVCLCDSAEIAGAPIAPGELLYLAPGRAAFGIRSAGPVHLLLIGGVPFEENVMLWWNFVGRSTAAAKVLVSVRPPRRTRPPLSGCRYRGWLSSRSPKPFARRSTTLAASEGKLVWAPDGALKASNRMASSKNRDGIAGRYRRLISGAACRHRDILTTDSPWHRLRYMPMRTGL